MPSSVPSSMPSSSTIRQIPNTSFYVLSEKKTWWDCFLYGRFNGYNFAAIHNKKENDDVFDYLESNNFQTHLWVGGYQSSHDDEPAGNWKWLDGTSLTYTNWAPGQPNNIDFIQDYVHLAVDTDRAWGDGQDSWKFFCLFRK